MSVAGTGVRSSAFSSVLFQAKSVRTAPSELARSCAASMCAFARCESARRTPAAPTPCRYAWTAAPRVDATLGFGSSRDRHSCAGPCHKMYACNIWRVG
eukprot:6211907-Pleurochrysis_carterae.AAC.3